MKNGLLKQHPYWFDDGEGNIYYELEEIPEETLKNCVVTSHSRFVNQVVEEMSIFKDGKFKQMPACISSYNPKLAIAMVNSGDYTFDDAVQIIVDCCERCLNILYNKYLGQKNFSKWYLYDKWDRPCKFCESEDDKYFEGLESSEVSLNTSCECNCCSSNEGEKEDDK